jgi:hypothetical protein
MCHQRLTFLFGPQINFIIGMLLSFEKNSYLRPRVQAITEVGTLIFLREVKFLSMSGGKSAVLSAITIALGGKTISTGRGNGLKAFIREGQRY